MQIVFEKKPVKSKLSVLKIDAQNHTIKYRPNTRLNC
jgi:hypothetical protein